MGEHGVPKLDKHGVLWIGHSSLSALVHSPPSQDAGVLVLRSAHKGYFTAEVRVRVGFGLGLLHRRSAPVSLPHPSRSMLTISGKVEPGKKARADKLLLDEGTLLRVWQALFLSSFLLHSFLLLSPQAKYWTQKVCIILMCSVYTYTYAPIQIDL